jgi:hypothetical protein
MKTLLISQDLWEIMEEDNEMKVKPVMGEETGKEKVGTSASVEEKDNRKKDVKTLYLIKQSISDKIFSRIIGTRSSKEAWEIL